MSGARNSPRSNRVTAWLVLSMVGVVLGFVAIIPMTWQQQGIFGLSVAVAALLIDRARQGRLATILMVLLCLACTLRYGYWRSSTLWAYLHSPWAHVSVIAEVLMCVLLAAELYTFIILMLGFFQSVAPLNRPPLLMPEDPDTWPLVDVMIPTLNESLDVVRYTVLAAKQIDWPADRLNIVLLDDGGRNEFRKFAADAGVNYIARTEHSGAKAGNLNNALRQTKGEFVTIFDCDHIPTRSFLQISIGWFLRENKLGMLQTPHHFYSPDPFERNLGKFRKIPNEGSLFYGIVQDANDLWNATFFCGSCATIRRSALNEIGGIAQETVTEDAHTSLRLQKAGWSTAYINIPQAAGLATETLARHVRQRIRWARGMVQILRTDNPLFGRGLTLSQRLCYFNATLHFLYAAPRLIFLTAPLLYLFFGMSNIPGYWLAILAFAGPHLFLTTITNSRIQGSKRHSFWNEIYETVLSPYILLPTLLALVNPRSGSFQVTDKGGAQEHGYFSLQLSVPFLVLLALNLAGLAMAFPRYYYWDQGHSGTIAMNVFWCVLNVVILGVALSVCAEERQRRHAVRIACAVPMVLHRGGEITEATTVDLSTGGVAAKSGGIWSPDEPLELEFPDEGPGELLPAKVIGNVGTRLRLKFGEMTLAQQMLLTRVLYSRADRWLEWDEGFARDRPLRGLLSVLRSSAAGFWKLIFLAPSMTGSPAGKPLKPVRVAAIGSIVLIVLGLALWRANASTTAAGKPVPAQTIERSFTLGSLSDGQKLLLLEQPGSRAILKFATPESWLIRSGKLRLKYQIAKNAQLENTFADIRLNDSVLATVTPSAEERDAGAGELTVPLPAELLTGKNALTVQLAGQANGACRAATQKDPGWLRIDPASEVVLEAQPLVVASELAALPLPFLDHLGTAPVQLPIIFAHTPDATTLESAGVLAAWFGVQADDGGVRFITLQNELPQGNGVVLLAGSEEIDGIAVSTPGSSVMLLPNPRNPYAKLLVVHGETNQDLLRASQALSTGQLKLKGDVAVLRGPLTFSQRTANDAPRWIHSNRVSLDSLMARGDLRNNGQRPINVYVHLAPDYNFGVQQRMYLHLAYQVESTGLAKSSNVTASLNDTPLGSLPLEAKSGPGGADIPIVDAPTAVYANTLQLQFYFVQAGSDPCGSAPGSSNAQILSSSYLDLGNAVHYKELPNLQLFSKAGFPFTRMADLSQSAVLLPRSPGAEILALYLDLMAYFGAQTGYPVVGVQVASIEDAAALRQKDLLLLGTFADLRDADAINNKLPLTYADRAFVLSQRARWALIPDWLMRRDSGAWQALNGDTPVWPDGLLEGISSPFKSGRSVVVIAGRDRAALPWLTASLLTTMPLDGIDSSVSLFTTGRFISYPLSTASYGSGDLPWYRAFRYWLPHHLVVLTILLFMVLISLASMVHQWLEARIRARLGMVEEFNGQGAASPQQG